ncbi:MAG: transposase [Candidatus Omnitrophica bacterium]|nr:transposase [Candidatus Omnitrophota bacterium]MBU4479594.1 transposase [Candidatus Omnitrophota bacterium]MCG2703434.1 transposase [Candidatus Omnitrophota bacterium]MCG2711395.1 transposase [Candidatus Omnitrophota bacterium]
MMGYRLKSRDEEKRKLRGHVIRLEAANEAHKAARKSLEDKNKDLKRRNEELEKTVKRLEEEKEKLRRQRDRYRDMIFKPNKKSTEVEQPKVSQGGLVNMVHRARDWLGPYYDKILEEIRSCPVKYADETVHRIDGINQWLWGFFTRERAYYVIEESRGKGVAEKYLRGSHEDDVLVRDDYGAYTKLP